MILFEVYRERPRVAWEISLGRMFYKAEWHRRSFFETAWK